MLRGPEAEFGREGVEDQGEVGAEARTPALAEAGAGLEDALGEGARLDAGWLVEVDGVAAGDHVDVGAGVGEEAGDVGGGGSGADDGDGAAVEVVDVGVLGAVGDKLFGRSAKMGGT